jgi:hypothetical protein
MASQPGRADDRLPLGPTDSTPRWSIINGHPLDLAERPATGATRTPSNLVEMNWDPITRARDTAQPAAVRRRARR